MAEIRLQGINKIYPGGTHAVHDVDLHIADGEFMIMVGPSGCAKSTILRMVAGLEVPTTGTVEIGGRVVNDVAPKDRDIAMVFQSYALYPHMTVRENMAFGLRLRRMPPTEIDQRVAEAARILGLEHLLDRLPKAMSGGQRQRVAMGRAIVREPQAFLMDEPLCNLDAKLRVQMRTEIAKLHQRLGVTTMYVTHDQVEAMTLGQRICILRKGVVMQVDTPFEVYTNPQNVFVGGFIGSPGMNFMNGHLVLHDGVLYLRLGEHHLPVPASVSSRLQASTDIHGTGVIVGIRPEHMTMTTADDPNAIVGQVELTEAMGAEVFAYFTSPVSAPDLSAFSDTQATTDSYVARLHPGADAPAGAPIWLRPDLHEVHLFDPQTMLTMLTPAHEAEVRARQQGSIVGVTSPTPVAVPPSAVVATGPVQPVIHLHQTFVQPEVGVGDQAAIASVFDQPVASPIAIEPLMPAAAAASAAPLLQDAPVQAHAPAPRPHVAAPAAPGAMPVPAMHAQATPPAQHPRPSFAEGIVAGSTLEAGTNEPAPVGQPVVAEAPRPRGFAPRYIGRQEDLGPAPTSGAPAPAAPALEATPDELDDAIDALETPEVVGVPAAPAAATMPVASTTFRDTLARIRQERAGERPAIRPLGTVLPPRVTLAPPGREGDAPAPAASRLQLPSFGTADVTDAERN